MSEEVAYEVVDPVADCVSPEGHDLVETKSLGSLVPVSAFCLNCGQTAQVVVWDVSGS